MTNTTVRSSDTPNDINQLGTTEYERDTSEQKKINEGESRMEIDNQTDEEEDF